MLLDVRIGEMLSAMRAIALGEPPILEGAKRTFLLAFSSSVGNAVLVPRIVIPALIGHNLVAEDTTP